jgi:transposase
MKRLIVLYHDNVRPHFACLTLGKIEKFGWKVLPLPPCSPDLTPSDDHLFGPLKDYMRSQHYKNDEAAQQTVCTWLQNTETDFCHSRILKRLQCWLKCLSRSGDLVE